MFSSARIVSKISKAKRRKQMKRPCMISAYGYCKTYIINPKNKKTRKQTQMIFKLARAFGHGETLTTTDLCKLETTNNIEHQPVDQDMRCDLDGFYEKLTCKGSIRVWGIDELIG